MFKSLLLNGTFSSEADLSSLTTPVLRSKFRRIWKKLSMKSAELQEHKTPGGSGGAEGQDQGEQGKAQAKFQHPLSLSDHWKEPLDPRQRYAWGGDGLPVGCQFSVLAMDLLPSATSARHKALGISTHNLKFTCGEWTLKAQWYNDKGCCPTVYNFKDNFVYSVIYCNIDI